MQLKIQEMIDVRVNQKLLDDFCDCVGVAAAIIDLEGNVIIGSRWQKICVDFHRDNQFACEKCIESDTVIANRLNQGEKYSLYRCKNGLNDAASPVLVQGRHIANAFVGQFLTTPPDIEFFKQQAKTYGFDEQAYLEALSCVPIIDEEKVSTIVKFLVSYAEMLSNMAIDHQEKIESEHKLSRSKEQIEIHKKANEAIEIERNRILSTLDGIDDVIYVADMETYELLHVNETFRKTWGEDTLGKKCYRVIQGRDEPCPFCTNEKILGEYRGRSYVWEFQNEETKTWYRCSDKAIHWNDGRIVRFEMASDITNIKKTEAALQERAKEQACLYSIAESVRRSQDMADVFCETVELIPLGWSYTEITCARIRYDEREYLSSQFKETQWKLESPIVVDGEHRGVVEVLYTEERPQLDEGVFLKEERDLLNAITRLLGEAVEKREFERELATLFKMSTDMICIADINKGTFQKVNPAFSAILGYDESEIVGAKFLNFNHPDDIEPTNKVVEEQLKHGKTVFNFENRYRCKDGSYKWLEWVSAPDKERGLTFAIARDITQRKRDDAAMLELNQKLALSNKELEQFAYVASHDLQEPLRMVASYTELLAEKYQGKLDEKADKYIGYAVDGAKRMQGLINDLLALSRVNTRGRAFEPTDCQKVLEKVLFSLDITIREKNAVVHSEPMPEVIGDETQLFQLFQNLISNALKFQNSTSPEIKIGADRQDNDWVFSVWDNGIGIDPKYFERIFVIFQRLHQRETYQGTGIGLSISKKIVERHGGNIWIESEPGQGSTFYFSIPDSPKKLEESNDFKD
jgi:PAS domain S-box-containing protein